jgi:hypothetical protein
MQLVRLKLAAALVFALLLSSVVPGWATTQWRCKRDDKRENCQRQYDFYSIARFALKAIERIGPVKTFVVPSNFDVYAHGALGELRPVIEVGSMPTSGEYSQPVGYFLVHVFRVDESGAEFDGRLGPVFAEGRPGREDNCGTTFVMPFEPEVVDSHQEWASRAYKTQVCSSSHFIVPVGQ